MRDGQRAVMLYVVERTDGTNFRPGWHVDPADWKKSDGESGMNPAPWSLKTTVELLFEAGRIGLHYFEKGEWRIKADRTLVTPADGDIEAVLARTFDRPWEGSWMLGEETAEEKGEEYIRGMMGGRGWVVDPIDGTAPFAHRLAYWGTSIGLMEKGVLTEGAVILPKQGEIFISNGPHVYYADNVDVHGNPNSVDFCLLKPLPLEFSEGGMVALCQAVARRGRFLGPNPVHSTGCAVNALAYLMLGRYMAYCASLKLWDMAGVWPLLLKTGFEGVRMDGTPLTAEVNARDYELEAGSPRRWGVRGGAVFAPKGMAARMVPLFEMPERSR